MFNLFSDSKYCIRTAGGIAPALGLAQSFWALSQRDVPIAKALDDACSEGFEYLEVGLREERLAETKTLLSRLPLKLIAQGWAVSAHDATKYIERADRLHAVAINMHLGHAYMTINEAVDLVAKVQRLAETYGIPLLIETHRGRLTQDLFRTSELLKHLPDIAITLDVSHYLVAGETLGGSEDLFRSHLAPLLGRTALIHGRISNGQSIQVSSEDRFGFAPLIQSLWQQAMRSWLSHAPPNAVMVFEPELGPPPYSCLDRNGEETINRAAESRTLTQIALEAWTSAHDGPHAA